MKPHKLLITRFLPTLFIIGLTFINAFDGKALGTGKLGVRIPTHAAAVEQPNIIIILADDLGYSDIGSYGGEIQTPNLDQLAANGLRFTQFYNEAKCDPSRAALLTGLYHHQTQILEKQDNNVTLAEVLKQAGYITLISGKWHLPKSPLDFGFDRYFGFLGGAANYFTGRDFGSDRNLMRLDDKVYDVPESGFYTTDAFTDHAIEFINESLGKGHPFFLYLAYNAPHFPLQALPEDIAKYRGKYMMGWDQVRANRFARMKRLGIATSGWSLTPRDTTVPNWNSLSEQEKNDEDLLMAVYAAMVDRMDQNIGRLFALLTNKGLIDNTLVMFFSDNGACPYDFNRTPHLPPGPADSYRTYDTEWANVSNTPFRLYKRYSHEGGIATPLILHWPKVIKNGGQISNRIAHIIDIMPTLADVAGAKYPEHFSRFKIMLPTEGISVGYKVLPMEGISLKPVLSGNRGRTDESLYWEWKGNRAVRAGNWKLVAERDRTWELYDMKTDRSEVDDHIQSNPQQAATMATMYDKWAKKYGAKSNAAAEHGKSRDPSADDKD